MILASEVPIELLLGPYGLLVFLLYVVIWGGRKKWWVYGRELDDCQKREDFWKDMATRTVRAAETGVNVTKKVVDSHVDEIAEVAKAVEEVLSKRRGQ